MQKNLNQENIIKSLSSDIIVSASAGCGKTTTMINRIAKLISVDKKELKNMLIVTYTNAAANDIKDKLLQALKNINHRDSFILKQLNYLDCADISTLHSFCSKVLRSYFYIVNIEPKFEVLEENNARCLKLNALNKVLKEYYENYDETFFALSEILNYNRNNILLSKTILELYEKSTCFINFESFTKMCQKACGVDLENNDVFRFIKKDITEFSESFIFKFSQCYSDAAIDKHKEFITECINGLKELCFEETLNQTLNKLSKFFIPDRKRLVKFEKEDACVVALHEELGELKLNFSAKLKSLKEKYAAFDEDNLLKSLIKTKNYVLKLLEIVAKFESEYSAQKNEGCALDFADLEKYTVKILDNADVLQELKNKFKYVFIDECQDINEVQDYIIGKLKPENLFSVGDVKQCIYRFRGAKPEIFIDKCVNAKTESFFRLDENFRTNCGILNFVNDVFSNIMFKDFSLVDYKDTEKLNGFKISKLSDDLKPVVIDIIAKENVDNEDEGESKIYNILEDDCLEEQAEREGFVIAKRINELVRKNVKILDDENYIVDKNRGTNLEYKDICILVRGKKGYTEKIYQTVKSAGIPINAEFKYSIREYEEIEELLQFLFLIDNFNQDIPLLSVLKSPLYSFTDRELSLIKLNNQDEFYLCFLNYEKNGKDDNLKNKVHSFISAYKRYREFSEFSTVSSLLELIIKERDYEERLLETIDGISKVKRVNGFLENLYGKKYEESLYTFNRFILNFSDEIKISENESAGNFVRINTIHQSKGLEYPVVILAGNQNRFNFSDSNNQMLYHPDFGIAFCDYDLESRTVSDTIIYEGIKQAVKYEHVKEELNILYVAMTRAKYRLYITSTLDLNKVKIAITKYDIKNSLSPTNFMDIYSNLKSGANFDLFTYDDEIEKIKIDKNFTLKKKDVNFDLNKILNLEYFYKNNLNVPVKVSVTEASKTVVDFENSYTIENVFSEDVIARGNMYHKILQNIDLFLPDEKSVAAQIEKFKAENIIDKESSPDILSIYKLINCDIIKNSKNAKIYREQPFIMTVPYSFVTGNNCDEDVLLQGKIDLLILKSDEAHIIDYKISVKDAEYLIAKYRRQLEIYGYAVKKILGVKNVNLYIYSLLKGELIEIK